MAEQLFDFDNPWRPNYEAGQTLGWFGAVGICIVSAWYLPLPTTFATVAASGCSLMGFYRMAKAWTRHSDMARTNFTGKTFIDIEGLKKASKGAIKRDELWLGNGYQWTDMVAQRMHALIASGVAKTLGKEALSKDGSYWLHGLDKEDDITVPLELLEGHTLIVGSTGVGKTRLFDLCIGQAILRGGPVVIIDPKGDQGLADNARRICESLGQPERFAYFNPAHPDKSVSLDPLRNWNRKTELASRVAALIPSETGADAFVAFGWKVLQDICAGLIATGERPNLVSLRRYIEGGPDDLLTKGLLFHFNQKVPNWEKGAASYIKTSKAKNKGPEAVLLAYIAYYKEVVIHEWPNVDLAGLISTYEHNRDHFQKMVASLIPILSMLTADPLAELLSPKHEPGSEKVVLDMSKVIRNNMVLYMGLDSLADPTVGSAIGSVMLADMTAVAGDIYNYGLDKKKPIDVFVDEAAEVINTPTIQLLNKGRGAGFRLTVATQTFADFAARLGDENKAIQVLANTNNKIALWAVQNGVAATQTYGTKRVSASDLFEMELNQRKPTVYDGVKPNRVVNPRETVVAREKQHLLKEAFVEWLSAPLMGDFVLFPTGELERFSHDMGDAIQTSPGGSFYLNADGRSSLSCGGLHPPIPTDSIEVIDGVTLQGRFWFFQHQQAGAGRGVYVDCACRVFMTSSPFDGFLGKDFLNPLRDELKALLEAQLKPA